MATSKTPQTTDFSRDVMGRYICNGFDEAMATHSIRPFDLIIIGGGTFGSVLAEHLWYRGAGRDHRILVLEGGPFTLPEHVQNLPFLNLGSPGASADINNSTTIQELRNNNMYGVDKPRNEVWGLPWQSTTRFPGLAYCIGGRSLYWGGWSPELLDAELPNTVWPASVINDLKTPTLPDGSAGYFHQSSDQIGVTQTNDFISGHLHRALREQLFSKIGTVTEAISLSSLPDHPAVRFDDPSAVTDAKLAALLGLDPASTLPTTQEMKDILKLEAPLAVQGQPGHAGFFPFNKFSAVPLLIKGAREAARESNNDDTKKRLMVVPNCHVINLNPVSDGTSSRVDSIDTNLGAITLPANGKVIIALGTIESTRLALNSFRNKIPANTYNQIGKNLMAHLRSNLNVLIPREALTSLLPTVKALQASALFVKGRHQFSGSTDVGHYHFQITASGLGSAGGNSEAELFKKIPDIDLLNTHLNASDTHVMITIRGIGEMEPLNPNSNITEDMNPAEQEFGAQRAYVNIVPSLRDNELWNAMDAAAEQIAQIFENGHTPLSKSKNRDGIGTTHHEAGTLRMGDDPNNAVTNGNGQFHHIKNAYALGPVLFPTIGSPNPMLTGVALARRMGDHLIPPAPMAPVEAGFTNIFDGSQQQFSKWKNVGGGNFIISNRAIITQPVGEISLLYYEPQKFENFILRLDFLLCKPNGINNDNSGVFVRFRDPFVPVPDPNNPANSYLYNNKAFVAVDSGFEIQIDDEARGDSRIQEADNFFYNRTGAIYKIKDQGTNAGQQDYRMPQPLAAETWHHYEIEVNGNIYIVRLNGQETTRFEKKATDIFRGNPPSIDPVSGFIGVQCHTGNVAFANIRIKAI